MIKICKKDIKLLEISPLGGILHIDKCQNDKNYKELLIYLGGPFASLILYIVLKLVSNYDILIKSSFYVLILNLLPILPLDGAKILMVFKQFLIPFRYVLKIITVISILVCMYLIIHFINNYNYIIILMFFLFKNLINYKNIPYDYYDFLCYKYFHNNKKLKDKIIISNNNYYSMFFKGYNNVFFINKTFVSERYVLSQIISKNNIDLKE